MSLDLSKLSPAPWRVATKNKSYPFVESDAGVHLWPAGEEPTPETLAALEFTALARNAFDVMTRRGWYPFTFGDNAWFVHTAEGHSIQIAEVWTWPDPFTALVEADRWYQEHVEKE